MREFVRVVGLVAGLVAAAPLVGCGDSAPKAAVGQSRRALVWAPEVEHLAIAAERSAQLDNGARVQGHVAVLTAAAATPSDVLSRGVRLDVGPWVDLGWSAGTHAFAYTADFGWGSDLSWAYTYSVDVDLHDHGSISRNNTLWFPRFPHARPVAPGSTALVVPAGTLHSLTATSARYDAVVVEAGATLRLGATDLQAQDLTLAAGSRLESTGIATVRVAGRLIGGDDVHVGTATATAGRLRLEVLGANGGLGLPNDRPAALALGQRAHVRAVLFAPHGTLDLGPASTSTGALVAQHVHVGVGARVHYEVGLAPPSGPAAYADVFHVTEDHALTVPAEGVLANDLFPSACTQFTAALVRHARSGTVTLAADGGFSYTPNPEFEGVDTFTYAATTGTATSAPATVTLVVDGAPDVPVLTSIAPRSAYVGQMWRYAPALADPDHGDVHTFALHGAPSGASVGPTTGLVQWMPSAAQLGAHTFELEVTDAAGNTDTQALSVDVLSTPAAEQFVLYADRSLVLQGKVVDGHVGVRTSSPTWMLDNGAHAALEYATVGTHADTALFARSVDLRLCAVTHDVYTDDLFAEPNTQHGGVAAFPAMPAFPATSAPTPGSTPLVVPSYTVASLSSTTSVGAVTVQDYACLELRPGTYDLESLSIGVAGCVVALGPVEVRIATTLRLAAHAHVGPAVGANIGTHQLRLEVHGAGADPDNPWSAPAAIATAGYTSISGTVIAPRGSAFFGNDSVNWGAFAARHVHATWGSLFFLGEQPVANRPPVIVSNPVLSATEGEPYSYTVVVHDADDLDVHTFALITAPAGATLGASGVITWPNPVVGSHTFVVRATDGAGAYDTQRFVLTVHDANAAPAFASSPIVTAAVGAAYAYDADATDADGDPITYALVSGPAGLTVHAATGVVSWTPSAAQGGAHPVSLSAADPSGAFAVQTFTLTVSGNQPPAFVSSPSARAVVLEPYASSTRAVDPDAGDTVTYSLVQGPAGLTLDAAGNLRWTPLSSQQGSHTLIVRAADGQGASTTQSTTIVVQAANHAPVFTSSPPTSVTEGDTYSYTAQATDADAGDTLTFTLDSGPAGMAVHPTTGAVSWTPTSGQVASTAVVLRVSDPLGLSAFQRFEVSVTNVNDAPAFTSAPVTQVYERELYHYAAQASDPDPGDTLTYTLVAGPSGASLSGRALSWTPIAPGAVSVTLQATDQGGLSATQSFSVTVLNVNDPPMFVSTPPSFGAEAFDYTYAPQVTDPDPGDVLTFQLDVAPAGMTVNPSNGTVTWPRAAVRSGVLPVVLRVTDAAGAIDVQSFTLAISDTNDAPVFVSTPVLSARENERYRYLARALDPDVGDTLTYSLLTGPAGLVLGPDTGELSWVPAASQLGTHPVSVRASDGRGGVATQSFALQVTGGLACGLGLGGARCGALGFAHTIRRDSVPFGGVSVTEYPAVGTTRTFSTDGATGLGLLGGQGPGAYRWVFTAEGHVPVSAAATLSLATVTWVGVPRLSPLDDLVASLTPADGGYANDVDGRVSLTFAAGAVTAPATVRAAVLDPQSLPLYPPAGWSPAVGVYYAADRAVAVGPEARLRLPAAVPDGATVVLARYEPTLAQWVSLGVQTDTTLADALDPRLRVTLGEPGGYAVFVADLGAAAPPVPAPDQALEPSPLAVGTSTVVAAGRVEPTVQTITVDSSPEDITGQARVWIDAGPGVPSGRVYPARLWEQYVFADARTADVPALPLAVAFYRYPRLTEAPARALSATFPVRPRHMLGEHDLPDVHQRIELRPNLPFEGAPLDQAGGAVAAGDLTLNVPLGALVGPALVRLEPLDQTSFELDGATAARAFELEWSVDGLNAGTRLAFDAAGLPPNTTYVLARRDLNDVRVVWQPVERMATGATGDLTSTEPTTGARLPGVTQAGTYVLFAVTAPSGLVVGTARSPSPASAALSGVTLRVDGAPWGAVTRASGDYALLGRPGSVRVLAERPPTHDTGLATGELASAAATLTLDVEVGPRAPFVVATTPIAGATHVRVVSALEVVFSEPMDRATLTATTVQLTSATAGRVAVQLSVSPDRRRLSVLPLRPLAYETAHTLVLTAAITDLDGAALTGATSFGFATALAPTRAGRSAQLVSYAPGAQHTPCAPYDPEEEAADFDPTGVSVGVPGFDPSDATITCVVGSAGVAEAGQPVILVNDESGATATVVARPNGSFKGFIRGRVDDLLSAVLINADGSRLTVPLAMQRFDDGRVALYAGGGIVTAPNPYGGDPFELIVEAGSIPRRGVFHFVPQTAQETAAHVAIAPPVDGTPVLSFAVDYQGDALRESMDIRLPMAAGDITTPAGVSVAEAGFVLAQQRTFHDGVGEVIGYDTLDRVQYNDGRLETHSFPMIGMLLDAAISSVRLIMFVIATQRPTTAVSGYVVACESEACQALTRVREAAGFLTSFLPGGDLVISILGLDEPVHGRRLVNAVVSAVPDGLDAAQQRGRLQPGGFITTTRADSRYVLALPLTLQDGFTIRATHPDFTYVSTTDAFLDALDFGGAVGAHVVFHEDGAFGEANGPIRVTVSHSPQRPAPLSSATSTLASERAMVRVVASSLFPAQITLTPIGFTASGGASVPPSAVRVRTSTVQHSYMRTTATFEVTSPQAGLARLAAAASVAGRGGTSLYALSFGGAAPPPPVDQAAPEPSDTTGPRVVRSWPAHNGLVPAGEPIEVEFNEPIDRNIESEPAATVLSGPGNVSARLSADRRVLQLLPLGLAPDTTYTLTLTTLVRDLRGNPLDQLPRNPGPESFSLSFRTTPSATRDLAGITAGANAVIHGRYAYVVDRGLGSGAAAGSTIGGLRIYDVLNPLQPTLIRNEAIPGGLPRSLLVIPDYSFVRPTDGTAPVGGGASVACNAEAYTDETRRTFVATSTQGSASLEWCVREHRSLLVLTGGSLNPTFIEGVVSNSATSQYVRVLDITRMADVLADDAPIPVVVSAPVTYDPSAVTSRLKWAPPYLGYVESTPLGAQVDMVNLQGFIIGQNLSSTQFALMPHLTDEGEDVDGDGSYLGPTERPPLPGRFDVNGYAGRYRIATVDGTTQDVRDYAMDAPLTFVGAALGTGRLIEGSVTSTAPGAWQPAAYRTLSHGNAFGAGLPRALTTLPFFPLSSTVTVQLDAIAFVPGAPVRNTVGVEEPRDVAVLAGYIYGLGSRVWLVDVTDPLLPTRIGPALGAVLPDGTGLVKTIIPDPDDPNLIRLVGATDVFVVDLGRLSRPDTNGGVHDAIIGSIAAAGSGVSAVGITDYGVSIDGSRGVTFTGPRLAFVDFPESGTLVSARALRRAPRAEKQRVLELRATTTDLAPARLRAEGDVTSEIEPPVPAAHHYVFLRAPGVAGDQLPLLVETTNAAGVPVPNPCGAFAPVRGATLDTLRRTGQFPSGPHNLQPLTAWRLSDDPADDLYNVYLSDPFVLVYERMSPADVTRVRGTNDDSREVYTSADGLRVSLDPTLAAHTVLGAFASRVSATTKLVELGVAARATSMPAHRILGPNPPAITASDTAEGTDDMVSVHNGAFEIAVEDLSLPNPRMPLAFTRSYRGQDDFDGPFGPGWDFDHNQRIVSVEPSVITSGVHIPLVVRDTDANSTGLGSGDVVFHNGRGDAVAYRRAPSGPVPPEYVNDPLLAELGWTSNAVAFYIPQPGVFDALVRFETGQFGRLTPDGTQYWYSSRGQLEKVYHRHPGTRHELSYTDRGELRRIQDVATQRHIDVGYFRASAADPLFETDLDRVATADLHIGRIARLVDDGGRDVLYHYDALGRLERVEGVEITTAVLDGFRGRRRSEYAWAGAGCGLTAVIDGSAEGRASFAAATPVDGVVRSGGGMSGAVTITPPATNQARAMANASTTVTTQDGAIRYEFNAMGLPAQVASSGAEAAAEREQFAYRDGVMLRQITYPRGNSVRYEYADEVNDPSLPSPVPLRSRGNIVRITRSPGPIAAAQPQIVERRRFSPYYNLPEGAQVDGAGDTTTVVLRPDRREVLTVEHATFSEGAEFDALGRPTRAVDATGVETGYGYDARGNLTLLRQGTVTTTLAYDCPTGRHGFVCRRDAPLVAPEVLVHNELGDLVSQRQGASISSTSVDQNGLTRRIVRSVGGSAVYTEARDYDQRGFLRSKTVESLETDGTPQTLTWLYTPDAMGRVQRVEHSATGVIESAVYDHRGRLRRRTVGDRVEQRSYDPNGNLSRIEVGAAGALVEQRRFAYDGYDRLVAESPATGGQVERQYDGAGRVTRERAVDANHGVQSERTVSAYDTVGRPLAWTDDGASFVAAYHPVAGERTSRVTGPRGRIEVTTHDASGLVTLESVAGLYTRTTTPDAAGRPSVVTSTEYGTSYTQRFVYEPERGQLSEVRDGNDAVVAAYDYRADGALVRAYRGPRSLELVRAQLLSLAGEPLGRVSAEGVRVEVQLDAERRMRGTGPSSNRQRVLTYDNSQRVTRIDEPDGPSRVLSSFEGHGLPQQVTVPGAPSLALGYDALGRLSSRSYGTVSETVGYDVLGRPRATTGAANYTATYAALGRRETGVLSAAGGAWSTVYSADDAGDRRSLVYPSGVEVADTRAAVGELQSMTAGTEALWSASAYAMAGAPSVVDVGAVRRVDRYDGRRRLTARNYSINGRALSDQRYGYDAADRAVVQQDVAHGARAQLYTYDRDSRVTRVESWARPRVPGDAGAPWSVASPALGAWSAGAYARTYSFDASEPDVVRTTSTSVWGGESWAPSVPLEYGAVDALGHVTAVDGITRGRDAQGNTTSFVGARGPLTVAHDSLARPTQVMRADGVGVRYTYRADGTRATREYACPTPLPVGVTCAARTEALVYRGLQLLEVHEVSPTPRVRARYYYEDDGDVPYAADLWQSATGTLARFVLLTDRQGSVVGVVDGTGAWIERVRYDLWGAPTVEAADTTAPALARVSVEGGELVVVASEAVLPAPSEVSSGDDGVVTSLRELSDVLQVVVPGTPGAPDAPVVGTWRLVERAGAERGRELRFTPLVGVAANQALALEVEAEGLWDGWSNAMASTRVAFTWGSGVRWSGSSASTGSPVLMESLVGNEVLFQSHTYEWAVGVYHMRARLMDPGTGLFLEVDPAGYEDAANMYVLMANDAVNHRDPTGASKTTGLLDGLGDLWDMSKRGAREARRAAKAAANAARQATRFHADDVDDVVAASKKANARYSKARKAERGAERSTEAFRRAEGAAAGAREASAKGGAADLSKQIRAGEVELPDSVLYRTTKKGPRGAPYGSPRNPQPPSLSVFNPRVYEVDAGNLRLNSTLHPTNVGQRGAVSSLSNSDLLRFRPEDPISSSGFGPGKSLNVTGGHHRLEEIMRRVSDGTLDPRERIRVLLHD